MRYVHSSIFPAPAEGAVEEFSESTYHDSYQSNALMSMPNMTDFNHYQEPRDSQFMSQEMPQEMIDFIRQQNLTQDNQPIEFHHQE